MSVTLCTRKLPSGNIQFYLAIYTPEEGKKNETVFTVKPENFKEKKRIAESIRSERELEIISKGTIFSNKKNNNLSLYDYVDNFVELYDKKDIRMIQNVIVKLKQFINNPKFLLKSLSENHFIKFANFLNNDIKLNGETPHSYWKRFKKIMIQANRDQLINESVYKNVNFKKKGNYSDTKLTKQVLTPDEIEKLFNTNCGNPELKRAFLFCCFSGLGYAEIKILTWSHIINNRLIINRVKTGSEINLALSKKALYLLGDRKESSDLIFDMKKNGKFISEVSNNKTLKNWLLHSGIDKHITFYCARHTFATRLLINGLDLKTVSLALAHTSITNTVKYLNYVDSKKDAATSSLD